MYFIEGDYSDKINSNNKMEVTLISVCGVLILYLIHLFFKKKYEFFSKQGIVGPTPYFWQFGNFAGVGMNVHFIDRVNEIYRNYHKNDTMAGFFLFTQPVYLIMDLELIKNILVRDFYHFHDRGLYHNENTDPLSAHLFSLDGERWKTLRAKLTATFSSGKIKSMFHTLTSVSKTLVDVIDESIEKNQTINYRDMCSRYMSDIIGLVAFGLECNALRDKNSKIMRMSNFLNFTEWNQRFRFIFANAYQDLSRKIGFQVTPSYIQDFFLKVIKDTVEYREKNNIERFIYQI